MSRKDYYYDKEAPQINAIVAAASAVVTTPDGKIVLHRRRDNDAWSLLGGKMEYGETVEATVLREIREEAGVDAVVKKLIGVYSNPHHVIAYADGEVRQEFSICFHCETKETCFAVSGESREVKAFSYEELKNLSMHPTQMQRIDDFIKNNERAFIK